MALRASFRPLRPDLDEFLFASVGEEHGEAPLSMVSALARLGLDPWDEAGRLSSLSKREAVEQLAQLIAELPGADRPLTEARQIAGGLVEHLPKHDSGRSPSPPLPSARRLKRWPPIPGLSHFWILCLVAAAAALVSIVLHGGFPFSNLP